MHTISGIVSDETLSRIIDIESAGNPNAKARTSSATGLGQFIERTWLKTVETHRPDLWDGRTKAQVLALRTDPALSIELLARLTEDNARALGAGFTDGDLYLAHFAGITTARKVRAANASAPASSVFTQDQIRANRSILEGKTVGQVRSWAARKMANADAHWVGYFADLAAPVKPEPVPVEDPAPPRQPEPESAPEPTLPKSDQSIEPESEVPPPAKRGLWQRVKGWIGLGAGGSGGVGLLTYFTSADVVLIIVAGVIVAALIGFGIAIWLVGKDRVRDEFVRLWRKCFP